MKKFENYKQAEDYLLRSVIEEPHFITSSTYEKFGTGFILLNPLENKNDRSNYTYAEEFFNWLLSGEKELSSELLELNPWVKRFVDSTNLPENFSSSYGWKIRNQLADIFDELDTNLESRRAYMNILLPEDSIIRTTKTTHEYPCTIGLHFFVRYDRLHLMVNMRSNNIYSVMPYDVYNFTKLQQNVARVQGIGLGWYYHGINSAHVFKGDMRRWKEKTAMENQC